MISGIHDFKTVFFIGVAGTGMSAIAQYLAETGKHVSGSDRYFQPGVFNDTKDKLEALGIRCFLQNGEGISQETNLVVVSTAVEDTVPEVQKAKQLNIPIIKDLNCWPSWHQVKKRLPSGVPVEKAPPALCFLISCNSQV